MSRSNELLHRFESLKCAPDIIYKLGKLDLKEITECYGIVLFMKRFPIWSVENALCLDVGCGKRPTLGIMLAHLRKWLITSIDPNLEMKSYDTHRFMPVKSRLQDVAFSLICQDYKNIILCANHSHHQFDEVREITKYTTVHYFVNPCCIDNLPKNVQGQCYINTRIWSDKNKLYYFVLPKEENELAESNYTIPCACILGDVQNGREEEK